MMLSASGEKQKKNKQLQFKKEITDMSTKATMKANRKNSHRASLITRWKMIRQAAPVSPAAVDVVMMGIPFGASRQ